MLTNHTEIETAIAVAMCVLSLLALAVGAVRDARGPR